MFRRILKSLGHYHFLWFSYILQLLCNLIYIILFNCILNVCIGESNLWRFLWHDSECKIIPFFLTLSFLTALWSRFLFFLIIVNIVKLFDCKLVPWMKTRWLGCAFYRKLFILLNNFPKVISFKVIIKFFLLIKHEIHLQTI